MREGREREGESAAGRGEGRRGRERRFPAVALSGQLSLMFPPQSARNPMHNTPTTKKLQRRCSAHRILLAYSTNEHHYNYPIMPYLRQYIRKLCTSRVESIEKEAALLQRGGPINVVAPQRSESPSRP